jgi:hypothetical protein
VFFFFPFGTFFSNSGFLCEFLFSFNYLQLYDGVAMSRQCFGAKGISGSFSIFGVFCLFLSVLVAFSVSICPCFPQLFFFFFLEITSR